MIPAANQQTRHLLWRNVTPPPHIPEVLSQTVYERSSWNNLTSQLLTDVLVSLHKFN